MEDAFHGEVCPENMLCLEYGSDFLAETTCTTINTNVKSNASVVVYFLVVLRVVFFAMFNGVVVVLGRREEVSVVGLPSCAQRINQSANQKSFGMNVSILMCIFLYVLLSYVLDLGTLENIHGSRFCLVLEGGLVRTKKTALQTIQRPSSCL